MPSVWMAERLPFPWCCPLCSSMPPDLSRAFPVLIMPVPLVAAFLALRFQFCRSTTHQQPHTHTQLHRHHILHCIYHKPRCYAYSESGNVYKLFSFNVNDVKYLRYSSQQCERKLQHNFLLCYIHNKPQQHVYSEIYNTFLSIHSPNVTHRFHQHHLQSKTALTIIFCKNL